MSDIHPDDIDPDTGRPYRGYSSPSLDTSFHDHEMDVDDEDDDEDEEDDCCPACGACPFFIGAECDADCDWARLHDD